MTELLINYLHFSYTKDMEVLKGIDLHLKDQTTAIVGQNGAGKTTFVKLLKGLLQPTEGAIQFNGSNTKDYTAANLAEHIGMVFQNPNDQIFKSKVLNEVMFGPLNIGQEENEARDKALEALKKVGLEDRLEKNPYDLSLSERKMISIAAVLAMDTDVVIFDEPTMGQDFAGKERIKEIISELRSLGKLVLCILHDMDFAAEVFERTIVFNQGNVLLDGSTRDVFSDENVLEQAFLEQPHVMQIAKNIGLDGIYTTESELVAALERAWFD
ncbi:energy-coupling factor transport system ATP-binding protein [Lentibacillus halodurans]|uniref:Energy-coupling factor transport system ATP-binding protein n=1 Tax=Lentibacillus halodurans TaxID=237679 RepID=A0A1I0YH08_9BACI|nr:ABC transporter ATP-binding protein [Lentibacillus halodurans]SFB12725.1 energy-coupling factor transport system ATP-binding protein [Lentibacillus halodurans]